MNDPQPDLKNTPKSQPQPGKNVASTPARLLAIALRLGSWAWTFLAWALLAWWALGQTLSDRFAWSQWARWTPTELIVALVATLAALAWIVRRLAGRAPQRGKTLRIVGVCVLGWLVLVPWRAWVPPARALLGTPPHDLAVMHWNANAVPGSTLPDALPDTPLATPLDLLIIVNALPTVQWDAVRQKIDPDATTTPLGRATIITPLTILKQGSTPLGLAGRMAGTRQKDRWTDPGWAGFFEIDTTAQLGQTTVVWVIDLPSDPAISRASMTQTAADAIHTWVGPAIATVQGTPTAIPLETPGFPPPDLIIGDFNIPRGSWSLNALTSPLKNAWHDRGLGGGFGPLGSWPRKTPLLHIDQAFLAPHLRSANYTLIDPGVGKHRAQILHIAKK